VCIYIIIFFLFQEVRLNRALEEVERCKAALAAERANKRGDLQQEKKDVEKLEGRSDMRCNETAVLCSGEKSYGRSNVLKIADTS
jgi:hypothetical protein